MVSALLAGRKTQTRRTIKPQPDNLLEGQIPKQLRIAVGDRLYVREHWRTNFSLDDVAPRDMDPAKHEYPNKKGYCRDGTFFVTYEADHPGLLNGRHRQAMHMPRWLSRLTLIVEGVKVERLNDIGEDDAIAEGVVDMGRRDGEPYSHCFMPGLPQIRIEHDAVPVYAHLWEIINGPGAWAANPWVVAYTFRVIRQNIDQIGGAA
jgi:hypothetical protein